MSVLSLKPQSLSKNETLSLEKMQLSDHFRVVIRISDSCWESFDFNWTYPLLTITLHPKQMPMPSWKFDLVESQNILNRRNPQGSSFPTVQDNLSSTPRTQEHCPNPSWTLLGLVLWPLPLGSLLQGPGTLWVKHLFLISSLNLPWLSFVPFPLNKPRDLSHCWCGTSTSVVPCVASPACSFTMCYPPGWARNGWTRLPSTWDELTSKNRIIFEEMEVLKPRFTSSCFWAPWASSRAGLSFGQAEEHS